MKKKLDLAFTRDISLFTCQFWNNKLFKDIKRVWGVGLSDQIINYNGKAIEAYRIHTETVTMKDYIVNLPLSNKLFSNKFRTDFKKAASNLRKLIKSKPKDLSKFLEPCLKNWSEMYPGYMLANFLPGPWADDFRKVHGKEAEKYLKIKFEDRVFVEGLYESTDLFLRSIVSKLLEKHKISKHYENLLTFTEFKELFEKNKAPKIALLKEREKGWVLIKGKLIVGKPFKQLLDEHNYYFEFPKTEGIKEFKGQIAYRASPVTGRVRLVFNQRDVHEFPENAVLVTAMTAPDHITAMKKAIAIITDEGGVTCHAAIVSRELKKPCIISTKIGSKVLKDNDLVEVDSEKGIIKIIRN